MITEAIGGFLLVYVYYSAVVDKRAPKALFGLTIGMVYGILNFTYGTRM